MHVICPGVVEHFSGHTVQALEETFMLARFTFKLLSLLGLGWKWNVQLWRLLLYAALLLPGFIQAGSLSLPGDYNLVTQYTNNQTLKTLFPY